VAQKLAEKNIPFLFVTGYGDRDSLPPDLRVYAQLTKPVTNAALTAALVEILQGKG
jgi:two-component SAPR family response regulator